MNINIYECCMRHRQHKQHFIVGLGLSMRMGAFPCEIEKFRNGRTYLLRVPYPHFLNK